MYSDEKQDKTIAKNLLGLALICVIYLAAVAFNDKDITAQASEFATPVQVKGVKAKVNTENLELGNISNAGTDKNNFLFVTPYYVISFNSENCEPNWTSWDLVKRDVGKAARQNDFHKDTKLPDILCHATPGDYAHSPYDRGHLCDSDDRTLNVTENKATLSMANMVPQTPALNRGAWKELEAYSRTLAEGGDTLHIVAGCIGSIGHIGKSKVNVPASCWKVIDDESKDKPQVIAVMMPNKNTVSSWTHYKTTVKDIEKQTGYHFKIQ